MARPPNGTMASIVPYKLSFRCTTNDFMFLHGGMRASRPTGILGGLAAYNKMFRGLVQIWHNEICDRARPAARGLAALLSPTALLPTLRI